MCEIPNNPFAELERPTMEVKDFIERYDARLSQGQKDLLNLLSNNVYGFELYEHEQEVKSTFQQTTHHVVFKFKHIDANGEINIFF
jgi:hypothetical protein